MSIDKEIAELEQKKQQLLEAEEDRKLQEKLKNVEEKLKGKVIVSVSKAKYSTTIQVVYYKDFKIAEKNKAKKLLQSFEMILISDIHYYGRKEIRFEKTGFDDYYGEYKEESFNMVPKQEMTVDQFKKMKASVKAINQHFIEGFVKLDGIQWLENGIEYGERTTVEKTEHLLDIPHIMLSQDEGWLLGGSAFITQGCFLLTPNSIKYLESKIEEAEKWDNFASSACASAGERWRGSKMDRFYALEKKIRNAYETRKP